MSITWEEPCVSCQFIILGEILAESESKMEESKAWAWKEEQTSDDKGIIFTIVTAVAIIMDTWIEVQFEMASESSMFQVLPTAEAHLSHLRNL